MFESMSYPVLQQYWWCIVSLLGALLVFLLFVQGGQTLLYTLGKTASERTLLVNSLGRKWEITFTTLVTFGGALFASFPLFYSTSFSGAYWVWISILFCFIIQAVSYEFRSKPSNIFGSRTFEMFLMINGSAGTILLGTAVGTFFTGSAFDVNFGNIANTTSNVVISQWHNPFRGLEAVADTRNVAFGLVLFFLARILGLMYFINNVDDRVIVSRAVRSLLRNTLPFLVLLPYFLTTLFLSNGYAVDPETGIVFTEKFKYLHNLAEMPAVAVLFIAGAVLILYGIVRTLIVKTFSGGIWYAGTGAVLFAFSLLLIAGLNNTPYYPSNYDLQSSLTISNSSSSKYTLVAMSYVSLFVPFVFAYIFYSWRQMNQKKISSEELQNNTHVY
jgi:cytochrome d ubiquinol oxidase subunit II